MKNEVSAPVFELAEIAAQKIQLKGWAAYDFEAIHGGVLCTGAVCPLVTRGPNKGRPNYRKADPRTIERVFIPTRKS